MRRREFITLVGVVAAWPATGHAQLPAMPKIGFLVAASQNQVGDYWDAFQKGLEDGGFVDGRNVAIEHRFAEGHYERLPDLAADLIRSHISVLVGAAPPAALAAKAATSTIPVVFVSGDDPIKSGLVERLNRPGANVTGISVFSGSQLGAKQLSLLHDLVPAAVVIALLVNPANAVQTAAQIKLVEDAAHDLGLQLHVANASSEGDFDNAFASAVAKQSKALIVGADPLFVAKRSQLTALAAHYEMPAIYEFREYAVSGGLVSYGPSLRDGYRQAGNYVARILKGEKPGDLPVMLPTKFELVINVKTAKVLNLTVPNSMQLLADEVIE
jgi:putative tryptophan/tyrosine transport system substrate-binding protein